MSSPSSNSLHFISDSWRSTDALRYHLLMRAVFSIGLTIGSMAALGAQSPHALIRSGKFFRRRSS
jgi:hypothetical protein